MDEPALNELRERLASVPAGTIDDVRHLVGLLGAAWDSLEGSSAEAMTASRLGRMEEVSWDPPILRFIIERHGGTVLGSTRAELHEWTIDVIRATASLRTGRFRPLQPRARGLNVTPIVADLHRLITSGDSHEHLRWSRDRTQVTVRVGVVIPATNRRTTTGRRGRLWKQLTAALAENGWHAIGETRWRFQREEPGATTAHGGGTL